MAVVPGLARVGLSLVPQYAGHWAGLWTGMKGGGEGIAVQFSRDIRRHCDAMALQGVGPAFPWDTAR